MNRKQLSPEPEGSGSAAAPTENSFDILSAEVELELTANDLPIPDKKEEKVEHFDDEGVEITDPVKLAEIEAEKAKVIANAEAEKGKVKLGEEVETEEQLIEKLTPEQKIKFEAGEIDAKGNPVEEGFKGTTKTEDADGDSSWIVVAKELGYPELKEDSFDAFKIAQETKIEEIRKEASNKDFEAHVLDLPAKEQLIVRGLKTGLTMEQIEAPIKTLDSLLSLSDAELLQADLKERGIKQDVIDYQVQKLTEEGNLDKEVAPIRQMLQDKRTGIETNLLEQVKDLEVELKTQKQNAIKEDVETFKKVMDTIPELMGTKLSKANKEVITAKYEKGEYHDLLTNHKEMAEYLLWKEYRKEAEQNLVNKALEYKRRGETNSRHVIPPIKKGAASSVSKVQTDGKAKSEFASVADAELEFANKNT